MLHEYIFKARKNQSNESFLRILNSKNINKYNIWNDEL